MTTTLTTLPAFATMDDYKTWRAAWRAEYAQLTLDIRVAKIKLRSTNREYSATGTSALYIATTAARCQVTSHSKRANKAIDTRHASKVRAAELYAATHVEVA
jgi:hypothetical protein